MSMFIHYKDFSPINMDLIATFDAYKSSDDRFMIDFFPENRGTHFKRWQFDSLEEVKKVHKCLLKRFSENIEHTMNIMVDI